jgi:hypothetical protein
LGSAQLAALPTGAGFGAIEFDFTVLVAAEEVKEFESFAAEGFCEVDLLGGTHFDFEALLGSEAEDRGGAGAIHMDEGAFAGRAADQLRQQGGTGFAVCPPEHPHVGSAPGLVVELLGMLAVVFQGIVLDGQEGGRGHPAGVDCLEVAGVEIANLDLAPRGLR